jgi:hypothetical protein
MSKHGRTFGKNLPAKGCFGKNMGRYEERPGSALSRSNSLPQAVDRPI